MKVTGQSVRDRPDTVSSDNRTDTPPLKGGLSGVRPTGREVSVSAGLPLLLTVPEAAEILRTTAVAVYAMVARAQLPGVTRLGRRVLIRSTDLLDFLDQKREPSPGGRR